MNENDWPNLNYDATDYAGLCDEISDGFMGETGDLIREHARAVLALRQARAELRRSEAWFGAWLCGCTDIERSPQGIPEHCPTHGEPLDCDDKGRTKVQLNHSGVSGYGMRDLSAERVSR